MFPVLFCRLGGPEGLPQSHPVLKMLCSTPFNDHSCSRARSPICRNKPFHGGEQPKHWRIATSATGTKQTIPESRSDVRYCSQSGRSETPRATRRIAVACNQVRTADLQFCNREHHGTKRTP